MRNLIILLFVCILFPLSALATMQEPDRILYKGRLLWTGSITMGGYPIVTDSTYKYTKWNTACARGYVATWELRNDSLFLAKVYDADFDEIPLSVLYPHRDTSSGVFASWFNYMLFARRGDRTPVFFAKFKEGKVEAFHEVTGYSFPMDFSGIWCGEDSLWQVKLDLVCGDKEKITGIYTARKKNGDLQCRVAENINFAVRGRQRYEEISMYIQTDTIKGNEIWIMVSPLKNDSLEFRVIFPDSSVLEIPEKCRLRRCSL